MYKFLKILVMALTLYLDFKSADIVESVETAFNKFSVMCCTIGRTQEMVTCFSPDRASVIERC